MPRAPSEVVDVIAEKLTALKRQRDALQETLENAKAAKRTENNDAEIEAVVGRLRRLRELAAKGSPRNDARRSAY